MKKITMIVAFLVLLVPNIILASSTSCNSEDAKIHAIKTVADAFYYRGGSLQYDDYSMTQNGVGEENHKIVRKRRSNYTQSPEEATTQDIKYTVCSEFVFNVFYEAFTKDGIGYTIKTPAGRMPESSAFLLLANNQSSYYNDKIAVYYIEPDKNIYFVNNDNIEINSTNYKQVFEDVLQPGDIIVYRYKTSGHILLYLGDDEVINATGISRNRETYIGSSVTGSGGSYNYQKKLDNLDPWGTVGYISKQEDVLNYKDRYSKYVFEDGTNTGGLSDPKVVRLAIIRPFNELTNDNISEKTCLRMKNDKLVRSKTASVGKYDSVNIGDNIEYTITLENKSSSDDYKDLEIFDEIPDNTEFVSFSGDVIGTKDNKKLSWKLDLSAGEVKSISYIVKTVKKGKVVNDKTVADGINLNAITTVVNNTLNENEKNRISSLSTEEGKEYNDISDFLAKVYPDVDIPTAEDIFKIYFAEHINEDEYFEKYDYKFTVDTTNNSTYGHMSETGVKELFILKNKEEIEEKYRDMYIEGLFGGTFTIKQGDTYSKGIEVDGRNSTYTSNTFTIGDIIAIYDDDYMTDDYIYGEKNLYLYLGNNKFATVFDNKLIIISETEGAKLIDSLLGQNSFIVLRPSYLIDENTQEETVTMDSIVITTNPTKTKYIKNNDELDLTGGIITVNYSNGESSTIALTNEEITVSGFNNKKTGVQRINVEYNGLKTSFEVEVLKDSVKNIAIKTTPIKTKYIQNTEILDLTGGIIKVTYLSGKTDTISLTNKDIITSGFSNNTLGTNTVTVSYDGVTTKFNIEIIENSIQNIEILKEPTKTRYLQNEENLDLTGGIIKVTYLDGKTDTISLTNENVLVSGFDNTTEGIRTITVTYNNLQTTFDIEIVKIFVNNDDDITINPKTGLLKILFVLTLLAISSILIYYLKIKKL